MYYRFLRRHYVQAAKTAKPYPRALSYFSSQQGAHIDVLINTTAFAMGEITPGGSTPAGWSVSVAGTT
jgi:cobaltochelatase CobN